MQNITEEKIVVSESKKYPNINAPHQFRSAPTLARHISNIDSMSALKFVINYAYFWNLTVIFCLLIFMYFLFCFWQCPSTLAEPELFQVGDKVNILDPYHGATVENG